MATWSRPADAAGGTSSSTSCSTRGSSIRTATWTCSSSTPRNTPEDILIQISAHNRGPEAAELHVLPTLWFRNLWSWHGAADRPVLQEVPGHGGRVVRAVDGTLGARYLYCEGDVPLLFTENETNTQRIFGVPNRTPYVKDSINDFVVHGQEGR